MHKNILTGEWKVSDLNIKKDWIFELQENDQKELIDATNQAIKSKKELFDLKASDFPLNKFKKKIDLAKHQLGKGLGFAILRNLPIKNFRNIGMIWAFEVDHKVDIQKFTEYSISKGILIRPINKTVYFMPPYCLSETEAYDMVKITSEAIKQAA